MLGKTRILIVDDSAFMRKSISIMLGSEPEFEIIATARDGAEGLELAKSLKPDIITLDIEMPKMNGLAALERIMKECPTSVIMVSSLTTEGADATLKALELGAVDFISKEQSYVSINIANVKDELISKIKTIIRQKSLHDRLARIQGIPTKPFKTTASLATTSIKALPKNNDYKAIAIGISTGGPLSLQKVIPKIIANAKCPIFIVQHMPPKFTKSLAERLNGLSEIRVKEAEDNEKVENGVVYVAPGGVHLNVVKIGHDVKIKLTDKPEKTLHMPSVDVMLKSLISIYNKNILGIIMTGMGKDGLEGIRELKNLGGNSVAQDEDSCIVYGMPRAIVLENLADTIATLEKIPEIINEAVKP